ncbi:hypothetical protein RSAG8_07226, partial [Rhizoctonia solani AG-8 WAC10335]
MFWCVLTRFLHGTPPVEISDSSLIPPLPYRLPSALAKRDLKP